MTAAEYCPLCQSSPKYHQLETNKVYGNDGPVERAFYHCQTCDVYFQWPRLTAAEEQQFYKDEFEKFMGGRNADGGMDWSGPKAHIETNSWQRQRRERYLGTYYKSIKEKGGGSLLEVGCSSGFMLEGLESEYGIKCFGVEPSGVFASFLEEKGLFVKPSLNQLTRELPEQKFDLISHFFVLEHIQDPRSFVCGLYDLLQPGGSLIMEIPNAQDPLRTLYPTQAFKDFYWTIAHPWYFTSKSMNYLLHDLCGFDDYELIGDQRYDIGNHTRWLREGKPGGQGQLRHIFNEEFDGKFRQCLIDAGQCDTLVAFVRKS